MTLQEIIEILKEIFYIAFIIMGILAVIALGYSIITGVIKSITLEKEKKKAKEELDKAINEFCVELIKELEKEEQEEKKVKKTRKTTKKTNN